MARFRNIRRWGNSLVLIFHPVDEKDLKINEKMEGNIEDMNFRKKKQIKEVSK
jgi:antitoxin component of MazEF toxin-antitoxin module